MFGIKKSTISITVGYCKAITTKLNSRIISTHFVSPLIYSRCRYYSTNNNKRTPPIDQKVYEWNGHKTNAGENEKPRLVKRIGRDPKELEVSNLETVGVDEMKMSGVNAVLSVFNTRKDDIIKIYLTDHLLKNNKQVGEILKFCATYRRAYRIVKEDDLVRLTKSTHHEGIAAIIKQKPQMTVEEAVDKELKETEKRKDKSVTAVDALYRRCILVLDGVSNHHNIGAILRACISFNVTTVIYTPKEKDISTSTNTHSPKSTYKNKGEKVEVSKSSEEGEDSLGDGDNNENSGLKSMAIMRVAEGAGEHVNLVTTTQQKLVASLNTLKSNNWKILVSTSHPNPHSIELWSQKCQKIMFPPTDLVLVVGSENEGVSNAVQKIADEVIRIPTTDIVESLNVSQATSVLLAEMWRLSVRPTPKKQAPQKTDKTKSPKTDKTGQTTVPKTEKQNKKSSRKSSRVEEEVEEIDFEGETDFLGDENDEDVFVESEKKTKSRRNASKGFDKKQDRRGGEKNAFKSKSDRGNRGRNSNRNNDNNSDDEIG
eukprot:TRINITY_DN13695_c0_g1_i1.p1 TRINITY_DN13695_c0_g1~~TRINITY_DN13695_c0_g1_i1.p1  ORF type:complete len:541 (+),score=148.91 TRINITY_DN13695_c0_g1_i1:70-1692(+)